MTPDDGSYGHGRRGHARRPLIERYQDVAQLSRQMLEAACREDWDEVARLEVNCKALIEQLKQAAMIEPLSVAEQRRRVALLRDILRNDAQMRTRAEPWLLELERWIGLSRRDEPSD